jgi:Ras-related protein Rab-11A
MRSGVVDNEEQFDHLLKIILVGDVAVGKTNLITRYTTKAFSIESKPTLGIEFSMSTLYKNGKTIRVQIWDTSGQEIYKSMTKNYFKGAHGAIIVYDITKHKTFEHVSNWLKDINEAADLNPVIMMVGNKRDLLNLREVQQDEAIQYAKQNSIAFIETSALDMTHVEVAFQNIINGIITSYLHRNIQPSHKNPR